MDSANEHENLCSYRLASPSEPGGWYTGYQFIAKTCQSLAAISPIQRSPIGLF